MFDLFLIVPSVFVRLEQYDEAISLITECQKFLKGKKPKDHQSIQVLAQLNIMKASILIYCIMNEIKVNNELVQLKKVDLFHDQSLKDEFV